MSAREELLAQARRHMWAAWQDSSEELASQAVATLHGLGMLVPEGGAQELEKLRARVAELEALTPATIQTCRVCGAGYTYGQPCSACEFKAQMAAAQAQGGCPRNVIDGDVGGHFFKKGALSDSPVACVYCGAKKPDGITRRIAPTQALREEPAVEQPLTVYRASHDSIVMGLYTTREAAQAHCETEERRAYAHGEEPSFDWIEDEEDGVTELTAWIRGEECTTGYVVTALEVAAAHDPEADE